MNKRKGKRRKKGEITTIGAILESSKYVTKSADFLVKAADGTIDEAMTDEAVHALSTSLHSRRLISYGGVFREAHKKLKLDDAEDGDLLHVEVDSREGLPDLITLVCTWRGKGGYEVTQRDKDL